MRESMIVQCATCGMPGKVVVDTGIDEIVERFFVCKCPRPSLTPRDIDEAVKTKE